MITRIDLDNRRGIDDQRHFILVLMNNDNNILTITLSALC